MPLNLPVPIKRKFGFRHPPAPKNIVIKKHGQQSLISEDGKAIQPPNAPQTWWKRDENLDWNHVWLRDSAQATAYAIEIARTLSSPTYPLRLAHKLAGYKEPSGSILKGVSTATEVLGSYLLLSAHELSGAVKEAAGVQLLGYLAKLESATADFIEEVSADRLVRLRGLASLALINLDGSTKRLLLDEIMKLVTTTRFINDETRIALMAVLLDSMDETLQMSAGTPRFDQRVRRLLQSDHVVNSDLANVVRSNYWSLTLSEHSLGEQFEHALRFFGAGEAHGDCMDRLKDAESWVTRQPGPSWASCRTTLQNAYSMICCGDEPPAPDQSNNHVLGDLFRALCSFGVADLQLLRAKSAQESVVSHSLEVKQAIDLITRVRKSFQESMIRFETNNCDEGFSVFMTTIQKCIEGAACRQKSAVKVVLANRDYSQAVGARYLLFGIELGVLLDRLVKDALRNAPPSSGPAPPEIAAYWVIGDMRALVLVEGDSTGEIRLKTWNCGSDASDAEEFVRQQTHLAIIHHELGTKIKRYTREIQDKTWFCTEIAFKWVPGGKS